MKDEDKTREQLLEELAHARRRLQRQEALRAMDLAITASLDLCVTFGVLFDQATTQLGVDAIAVLLVSPHTQTLSYAAGRGFRSDAVRRTHLRPGEGHAGRTAMERRILFIPNLSETPDAPPRAPLLAGEDFIAYYAAPLIAKGQVKGVLELFHRSDRRAALQPDTDWMDFVEALATQAAIAIDNAGMFDDLQRSNFELIQAYDTTLEGWSRALDIRDKETEGHTRRVTDMTVRLARYMGLKDPDLAHIRRGALLHDVGKMAVPDGILLKAGMLTREERETMRKHPDYALEMLSPIAFLAPALDIPYCHHEDWDGSGYPRRLSGERIPFAARIFAVVDAWDALRSTRPYRPAWDEQRVRQHLRERSGKEFDPKVVEAFLEMLEKGD